MMDQGDFSAFSNDSTDQADLGSSLCRREFRGDLSLSKTPSDPILAPFPNHLAMEPQDFLRRIFVDESANFSENQP